MNILHLILISFYFLISRLSTCNTIVKEFKWKCVAVFSSLLNDEILKHVYDDDGWREWLCAEGEETKIIRHS